MTAGTVIVPPKALSPSTIAEAAKYHKSVYESDEYDRAYSDFDDLPTDEAEMGAVSDITLEPPSFHHLDDPTYVDKYKLATLAACNGTARFEDWKRLGGTLLGSKKIGCGINALTFLGVFTYRDGERLVQQLRNKYKHSQGTSFSQIIDFTAIRTGVFYQEMSVPVSGKSKSVYQFLEWVKYYLGLSECTIVKFNRSDGRGHTCVFSKDAEGFLWLVDPQNMSIEPFTDTLVAYNSLVTFVREQGFVTASLMFEGIPGSEVFVPWRVPDWTRSKLSAYQMIQIIKYQNRAAAKAGKTKKPLLSLSALPRLGDMVHRRDVLHSRPITVPITNAQVSAWATIRQTCTTDTACTENVGRFLGLLSDEEYTAWIKHQNEHAMGQTLQFVAQTITAAGGVNFQVEQFDVSSDASLAAIFRTIPYNHATIASISRSNGQIGHSVVFATTWKHVPVLFDTVNGELAEGIPGIRTYLSKARLDGVANIPTKYTFFRAPPAVPRTRNTKRKRTAAPPFVAQRTKEDPRTKKARTAYRTSPFALPPTTGFHVGVNPKPRRTKRGRRT